MQCRLSARVPRSTRSALAIAALLAGSLVASAASTSPAQAAPAAPEDRHGALGSAGTTGYSDPAYYPLRYSNLSSLLNPPSGGPYSARLGCVQTNCHDHQSGGHDTWAIDLVADKGDPVHAAGGGVLHVASIHYGCTTEGPRGGTSLWIDHGGGVTSSYRHLSAIEESLVGRFVGPQTKIGEVGRSGNTCGIDPYYLHFEVRRGGLPGRPVRFDQLLACRSYNQAISLPAAMGDYRSWDDVPYRGPGIPATGSNCMPTGLAAGPAAPSVSVSRGNEKAQLSWSPPPADTDGVVIASRIFRPSTGQFSREMYQYLDGAPSSHVAAGLINGRRYRYRVAFHAERRYSDWSAVHEVVPGGLPSEPDVRRLVATGSRIGIGWTKSDGNGRPIDGYRLAIRRRTSAEWTTWTPRAHPHDSTTYNWYELRSGSAYQVRVRARTEIGSSTWVRRSISTER